MKMEIEAPWGNYKFEGMLGFFKQSLDQLLFFQKQSDTLYIRRDIKGYTLLLETKSEKMADMFMEVKGEARESGKPFEDNMAVVKHMKDTGIWES